MVCIVLRVASSFHPHTFYSLMRLPLLLPLLLLAEGSDESGMFYKSGTTPVLELEPATFQEVVISSEDDQLWVVEFYAHWCGHCLHYKPIYVRVASELKEDKRVRFAGIDCAIHVDTCNNYDIMAYPVIHIFRHGEKLTDQEGVEKKGGVEALKTAISEKLNDTLTLTNYTLPEAHDAGHSLWKEEPDLLDGHSANVRLHDGVLAFSHLLWNFVPVMGKDSDIPKKRMDQLVRVLQVWGATIPSRLVRNELQELIQEIALQSSAEDDAKTSKFTWQQVILGGSRFTLMGGEITSQMAQLPDKHWKTCKTFSCGLWQLFHLLTFSSGARWTPKNFGRYVSNVDYGPGPRIAAPASDVMESIRTVVDLFFACEICREHFLNSYDNCLFERCREARDPRINVVMWLWRLHNHVNNRTATERGIVVEDTKWPPKSQCDFCFSKSGEPFEDLIYQHMSHAYWNPLWLDPPSPEDLQKLRKYHTLTSLLGGEILLSFLGISAIVGGIGWRLWSKRRVGAYKRTRKNSEEGIELSKV